MAEEKKGSLRESVLRARHKTKIVCTIGPASESLPVLQSLIQAGMDVARLNFSHGSHEEHLEKIKEIRRLSDQLKKPVTLLQDLSGPKIRVGRVKEGGVELKQGEKFILTNRKIMGDEKGVSVNYAPLPKEVKAGDILLLADGAIELQALRSNDQDILCQVIVGGKLTSNKGINFPTGTITVSPFTKKDREDLLFGIRNGVDMVSLSYVKDAGDIEKVKRFLKKYSASLPVIAKIERKEALENIDKILMAADGIMVARGDLGVETPIEKIPTVQKMLIRKANTMGKPVITATQMLRSMVDQNRPTRAEVTDVVNAIYDGTDAVMLSEETAIGQFPVETVQMMARIARAAEEAFPHHRFLDRRSEGDSDLPQAISQVASILSERVKAVAIVVPTESGSTARWVSRLRPKQPVIALSRHYSTVRSLNLCWGVTPLLVSDWRDTDDMLERVKQIPKKIGLATRGDRIVIIAGVPISIPGTTNLIKVEVVE